MFEAVNPPRPPRRQQIVTAIASMLEAPAMILPERPDLIAREFVAGGVEGGVVGGIAGGIVGGISTMPAPPPPPSPAPAPVQPVRVGGDIDQPTLLHRVNPQYPQIAISAKKEGIVIGPTRSS